MREQKKKNKTSFKKDFRLTRFVSVLMKVFLMLAVVVSLFGAPFLKTESAYASGTTGKILQDVSTDKAQYKPGDQVNITVHLRNTTGANLDNHKVTLYFKNMDLELISSYELPNFSLADGASTTQTYTWTPPSTNLQSYMIEAWVRDSSNAIKDNLNTVIRVSVGLISEVYTDKAQYTPGNPVNITVKLKNETGASLNNLKVTLNFKHLEREIADPLESLSFSLADQETKTLPAFEWQPPTIDFKGYTIEAWLRDGSGTVLDNLNTAVDVSSTWTKFPRYGYLSTFNSQTTETSSSHVEELAKYHINALQFYDWHYKHHMPLKGTVDDPATIWTEVANREVHKQTIDDYIQAADENNISSMAYDLVYGAFDGYQADGVNKSWGIFEALKLTNGNFEEDFKGWWEWHPDTQSGQSYIVENLDGSKKLKFSNSSAYKQSAHQTLINLDNGLYTVTAWVKAYGTQPNDARMEVNGTQTNVTPDGVWRPYTSTVTVSNGTVDVGFYIDSPGGTTMLIDEVELTRTNLLTNGGFESGDLTGWTEWHPEGQAVNYGVDGTDVHEGSKKLYFWNESASVYHQSVHQSITGLSNGTYTASAWVKTNGQPHEARMEVNGTNTNMVADGTWRFYTTNVSVTNGTVDVGFYANLAASSGLQIDHVVLTPLPAMQWNYAMPSGWATPTIWLMNPGNVDWQNYLIDRFEDVYKVYDFDGWHMDQIGNWPFIYKFDSNGTPIDQTDGFASLINNAKATRPDKTVVFNNVNSYGYEDVSVSNSDIMYTELWKQEGESVEREKTFSDIKDFLDIQTQLSGKSTVFPMYMNYIYQEGFSDNNPGEFNTEGVLMADAGFFAMGAHHLELGDQLNMLDHEYFPNKHLLMSNQLKQKLLKYYDFSVAYENLLRDGLVNTNNSVVLSEASSNRSDPDKVWTFTKAGNGYEVIHLVNQLGINDVHVRDLYGNKRAPIFKNNVQVKYYYTGPINQVNFASPDYENGKTIQLPFTRGSDTNGSFVEFTVPTLQYWDMIYINKGDSGNLLTNGDFEAGDLTGWTEWHPNGQTVSYGVNGTDAYEGTKKLYLWNESASTYHQSMHQVRRGLSNGTYTVSAWVKTNGIVSAPYEARMEVNGSSVVMDVFNTWKQYKSTVTVTDGKVDVGFYANLPVSAGIQVDDVILTPTNLLTNGGFEAGDISGWTEWHPSGQAAGYGVDSADAQEGTKKLFFFKDNSDPFHQSVHQVKTGLLNGSYTVSALVKTTCQPYEARMEVNGVQLDVIGDGTWKRYTTNVTVDDGTADVGFYANLPNPGPSSIQIDDVVLTPNYIVNGGFETGNLSGWTEWHPSGQTVNYGVDGTDVFEGTKKLYMWNENAAEYHQSVHQVNSGLANGTYRVTAWVKINGTYTAPYEAKMEVNDIDLTIAPAAVWKQIDTTVTVTNGTLDVGFYVNFPSSTSIQVDNVSITKLP